MTATLAEVRRHCMHPLWFDAEAWEIADWLGVEVGEVHRARRNPAVRQGIAARHAADREWRERRRLKGWR